MFPWVWVVSSASRAASSGARPRSRSRICVPAAARAKSADTLSQLERFCLFVGYPRSGHSLVGSLLDAHPDIAISHELHVLRYRPLRVHPRPAPGADPRERRSAPPPPAACRRATATPSPGCGRAVSDTCGWRETNAAEPPSASSWREPERLETLRDASGRSAAPGPRGPQPLRQHRADGPGLPSPRAPGALRSLLPDGRRGGRIAGAAKRVHDVYHEAMIDSPREELAALCDFLGARRLRTTISMPARKIVWTRPQQTRREFEWPAGLREHIATRLGDYPFFARYSFEESEASAAGARSEA